MNIPYVDGIGMVMMLKSCSFSPPGPLDRCCCSSGILLLVEFEHDWHGKHPTLQNFNSDTQQNALEKIILFKENVILSLRYDDYGPWMAHQSIGNLYSLNRPLEVGYTNLSWWQFRNRFEQLFQKLQEVQSFMFPGFWRCYCKYFGSTYMIYQPSIYLYI